MDASRKAPSFICQEKNRNLSIYFLINKKTCRLVVFCYPFPVMKLLTTANTKIKKGEKLGFMSFGIHLAPAKLSGFNVCKSASAGCTAACLNTAGMGIYSTVQAARIAKTRLFFRDKTSFMSQLVKEIGAAVRKAKKNEMQPAFRLNLTSDLPWEKIKHEGKTVFEMFPSVQFYDYTKIESRISSFLAGEMPKNYHLTFSRSETTPAALVESVLKSKGNVAIVFRKTLPKKWNGFKVVNGDESDIRFKDPKGVIVGLVDKGKAKKDDSGFVISL